MPPAKRKPARRTTVAKARKPAARKHPASRVKIPRTGPLHAQIGARMVLFAVSRIDIRPDTVQSRKDAAILRATHKGCPTCKGNGQVFTKGKDGSFTGSKPCPAKPTKQKASRWEVYKSSRFGADKNTGLVGWTCPCGKKEKPRYRDAREATKALRTHERARHQGKTVGGAWYAQATEGAASPAPAKQPAAVSKVVTDSGVTDEQWIKKNKPMAPAKAIAVGKCWQCAGAGRIFSAFGGQQLIVVCSECRGNGAAPKAA
ncbi:hypothetical protein [Streptomyces sp. NPDC005732]|uniref:hypothetical protein n=1 Tax=Streptomyces sp. NPDC005732 TaxID=3157057 RepID=UPI00340F78CE